MPPLRLAVFGIAIVVAGACGKSRKAMLQDVEICSGTSVASSIAECLRATRDWDSLPSESAGAVRAHELDSMLRAQEDSAWRLDQAQHDASLKRCLGERTAERTGDVATCLRMAGWPGPRAARVADSIWATDSVEHRRQVAACARAQQRSNIADCLMLWYKWESGRALAANDSLQRARIAR